MSAKKFQSLRNKLMYRIIQILCLAFIVILSFVAWSNYSSAQKNLFITEENIRASIVAKGRFLVANNSRALIGMVQDNAFTAVQDLVSSTVIQDEELTYGIFMDQNRQAWIAQYSEHANFSHQTGDSFHDDLSVWADQLKTSSSQLVDKDGVQVYEFAAPVFSDEIKVGTIRYGISTKNMLDSLSQARAESRASIVYTLSSLIFIASLVFAVSYWVVRRFAIAITNPLSSLIHAAQIISEGDYATTVDVKSNDEIGLLSENFDLMRNTISKKINDLFEINSASDTFSMQASKESLVEQMFHTFSLHFNVISGVMYSKTSGDVVHCEFSYKNNESKNLVYVSGDVLVAVEGLVNMCILSKDVVISNNLKNDHRFNGVCFSDKQQFAMIFVPVLEKNEIASGIVLLCEVDDFCFEDGDYAYVKSIARSLSINIKNISMSDVIKEQNINLEKKIEIRTASLKEKTNDIVNMMKNLDQGLFTVLANGKIHSEYSSYLKVLLETDQIAGKVFSSLLFSDCNVSHDQVLQVEAALNAVIGDEEMTFILNKHIFINEFIKTQKDGSKLYVELDWNPIFFNGVVEKVMVTVRDVSHVKQLQQKAEEKERYLEAVGHLLHVGRDKFFKFVDASKDVLLGLESAFESTMLPTEEVFADLLRRLHTLKGNSRTHSFLLIANFVHNAETILEKIKFYSKSDDRKCLVLKIELRDVLNEIKSNMDYYILVSEDKLKWTSAHDSPQVCLSLLEDYNKTVDNRGDALRELKNSNVSSRAKNTFIDVVNISQKVFSPNLLSIIEPFKDSLVSIAEELSKPAPVLKINVDGFHIRTSYCDNLSAAFLHLLRNSIDHGIEPEAKRIENNKPKAGNISVSGSVVDGGLLIVIEDDGQGLDLNNLKEFKGNGEHLSDDELSNVIFHAGFSTSENVSNISGRGIGMDVVKHMIKGMGGDVSIRFTSENINGFRSFCTLILLPVGVFEQAIGV